MAHKQIFEIAAAEALTGIEQLHIVQGDNSRRVTLSQIVAFMMAQGGNRESFIVALSDETTALETGDAKVTIHMPYAFTLIGVTAGVTTAPDGSAITVDVNVAGVSILSTPITIDDGEKSSALAAVPAVISAPAIPANAEVSFNLDAVGSVVPGAGLKVTLIGYQTPAEPEEEGE